MMQDKLKLSVTKYDLVSPHCHIWRLIFLCNAERQKKVKTKTIWGERVVHIQALQNTHEYPYSNSYQTKTRKKNKYNNGCKLTEKNKLWRVETEQKNGLTFARGSYPVRLHLQRPEGVIVICKNWYIDKFRYSSALQNIIRMTKKAANAGSNYKSRCQENKFEHEIHVYMCALKCCLLKETMRFTQGPPSEQVKGHEFITVMHARVPISHFFYPRYINNFKCTLL